jgi:putative tricarboxylic transport membrane protein
MDTNNRRIERRSAFVGVLLFVIAVVTYWDASQMVVRAGYGIGANVTSYFVAVLFAVLAIGHFVGALKPAEYDVEAADWKAVGWIAIALTGLVASIWFGGGFILGSALLFAFTARAFGRFALPVDLCLGFAIGFGVFLFFNKLLTLALPMGPLERLL